MVWWQIIVLLIGIVAMIDIIRAIYSMFRGNAGYFTYYISRPIFGLIEVKMFTGFLIYLAEVCFFVCAVAVLMK